MVDQLSVLKKVDFNLFVAALRFPIACYQLAFWLKDEIIDYCAFNVLKSGSVVSGSNSGSSRNGAVGGNKLLQQIFAETNKDAVIDIQKLKPFIQQR